MSEQKNPTQAPTPAAEPKKRSKKFSLPGPVRNLPRILIHNWHLKLLSLLLAMVLWGVVVYNDSSITRIRTINNLTPLVNGQTTLSGYSLALAGNPLEDLDEEVTVEIEIPQSQYPLVTESNVRVYVDVSNIRSTGPQRAPLTAQTPYGTVKSIFPASVEVNVETLDARSVPVNSTLTGQKDGMWYNVINVNPGSITLSGASSIVQNLAMAQLEIDVSDIHESNTRTYPYILKDYQGNTLSDDVITRSSSSVTAAIEIYPTKELPIACDIEDVLSGSIKEGYEVESITVNPPTITVAADQALLDNLTEIPVKPYESGAPLDRSYTFRTAVSTLSDIHYLSSEQVYVTINVTEHKETVSFDSIPVQISGLSDTLHVTDMPGTISLKVTGPASKMESLSEDMIIAVLDLSDAAEGTNQIPVNVSVPGITGLSFEMNPATLDISLQKTENAD